MSAEDEKKKPNDTSSDAAPTEATNSSTTTATNTKPTKKEQPEKKQQQQPPKAAEKKEEETAESLPEFEKNLADKISDQFGSKTEVAFVKENRIRVNVDKDNIKEVAEFIRDEMNFDHAESVTGVDFPDDKEIEIVYHLGSYTDPNLAKQVLALATRVPREDSPNPGKDSSRLPSLRDIFYSVEFHERECFEMLGVYFEGHPDNRRLLLPEDWADLPPLRKDFRIKGR